MKPSDILKLNAFHTYCETKEDGLVLLRPPQPKSMPYCPGYEILLEEFKFSWKDKKYTIPKGFIWDGASIPRLVWRSFGHPFMQEFREASLIHDLFYDCGLVDRKSADEALKFFLRANGVSDTKASLMYAAVRTGGAFPWARHRKREKTLGLVTKVARLNESILAQIVQE